MRIEELPTGCGITLYVNIPGKKQLVFETKMMDVIPKKRLVLAKAIMYEGKVLSFSAKGITVDVVAAVSEGDRPVLFRDVITETRKVSEDSYCYNLITKKEGTPVNRRKNFRCFIGNDAILQRNGDIREFEVIVRDVSASGFSVTCDAGLELNMNQLIQVAFKDDIEDIGETFSFHLHGIVVRRQDLENGKIIYGCRLNNRIGGLETYLVKKERVNLQKNRG